MLAIKLSDVAFTILTTVDIQTIVGMFTLSADLISYFIELGQKTNV